MDYQSGFRSKHSCETACQLVCNKWKKDIDDGKVVISVFIDLKRAFETIDRNILIKKCRKYGIKGVALQWIANYLENRYQRTKMEGTCSKPLEVLCGVPQGSVLGPLLFILYINDINLYLINSFVNLFADDTVVSVSGVNFSDIVSVMNSELNIFSDWLKFNKLKLNTAKTKCMVIGTKIRCIQFLAEKHMISIDNVNINYVNEIKYLGVVLDPQLKFNKHVDYLSKKIGKKIGYFTRLSKKLSPWAKKIVYNTIIYPHFNYCMSLLLSCTDENIHRLQMLQNKAMRVLLNCNKYTAIDYMLSELGFLNVSQLIIESNLILIHKTINNRTPQYLQEYLLKRSDMVNYNLRSNDEYYIQSHHTSLMEKTVFIQGLGIYNSLPLSIRTCTNIKRFKRTLRSVYFK